MSTIAQNTTNQINNTILFLLLFLNWDIPYYHLIFWLLLVIVNRWKTKAQQYTQSPSHTCKDRISSILPSHWYCPLLVFTSAQKKKRKENITHKTGNETDCNKWCQICYAKWSIYYLLLLLTTGQIHHPFYTTRLKVRLQLHTKSKKRLRLFSLFIFKKALRVLSAECITKDRLLI